LAIALMFMGAATVAAQLPATDQIREPLLRDTPWGDFPLERLLPGARLRLTTPDGRRIERRVLALGDSSLELRAPSGESLPSVSFAALHAYRKVEVRALPAWSDKVGTPSAVGGAILGAVAGVIIHNQRKPSSPAVHRHGLLDDMASFSVVGGLVGWEIGIQTLGRRRWRMVTLP